MEERGEVLELRKSLVSHEARPGTMVRVVEDKRRPEFEGMLGIIKGVFGHPDYLALDVQLEDGRLELFWFNQLDTADVGSATRSLPFYDGS
jgi:hypothetical protein